MPNQYTYFAFISYNRDDEKWAKWLQQKLESYRLPARLCKENPQLPQKIRPIFRDKSDMSGGNLKQEIEKGLNESKYLIVICSPKAVQSIWVSQEIQYFISKGKEAQIIPFIISGYPNSTDSTQECFPKVLRLLSGEREILGVNINEMGREAAAIKVIAYMFNLRFDILWQRYRRENKKKILFTVSGILAILVSIVVFTIILWNKNEQIAIKNEELNALVMNLKEENITFSQIRNSKERYSYVGSIRGNESDNDQITLVYHPYEPIIAFMDDWGFWLHYINSNKEVLLPGSNLEYATIQPEGIGFSDDGSLLYAAAWNRFFEWKIEDCSLNCIKNTDEDDITEYYSKLNMDRLGNSYTVNNQCNSNPIHNEYLYHDNDRVALYDSELNQNIQFFKGYSSEQFIFSQDGEYLSIGKDIFKRNHTIDTISTKKHTILPIRLFPTEDDTSSIVDINLRDERDIISYKIQGRQKAIEVIKPHTIGNEQEYLCDAKFLPPNKIIAIVAQGKHRIYNSYSGELLGTVPSYIYDGSEPYGHEDELCHAESYIVYSKIVDRDLYVVSSGGIIRIYDIDKLRMKTLIELPYKFEPDKRVGAISKCHINSDGSIISYTYGDDSQIFHQCYL